MIRTPKPQHKLTQIEIDKEIETASRYYREAKMDYEHHFPKDDLIGRALRDITDRFKRILENARKGIPFGAPGNK